MHSEMMNSQQTHIDGILVLICEGHKVLAKGNKGNQQLDLHLFKFGAMEKSFSNGDCI